jgi:murein DD-endopeptidase MepM/ murein hydrolase activator NlpD
MKRILLLLGVVVIALPVVLAVLSSSPSVTVDPGISVIGMDGPVSVTVASPHGIRNFTAELEQDGARYKLLEENRPARRLFFFGRSEAPRVFRFNAGRKSAPALKDGKAVLVVSATANDFRASTQTASADVKVNTQPPRVSVDGFQHYINQGGAELVVFTVSGYWTEAGVRAGPYTFRSFPLPGRPAGERFALFAFPWDLPAETAPYVYARNPAGNEAHGQFWFKVFPKKFRTRDLEISDAFLDKVVNQIDPSGSGDLLSRFLKINSELRKQNNKTLFDLRLKTEERLLWSGPFYRYGKTESQFADSRNYVYHGKTVDHQTHLGFDLSDVQHVPVVAANDGKVVWASDLGIYGNCIVVDHGYGLQSIYGHLSRIDVKPGDELKKGQAMGLSGSTGLAGGDHIHFSLQVDGVQVTPVEWWDEHWIHDRILSKLAAAKP